MKKILSLLTLLLLASAFFSCGPAAGQSAADSSAPVVMELVSPLADPLPQLTAKPAASTAPEAEQRPVPIEGNDAPDGDGSGNFACEIIRLIPYGDKLYYVNSNINIFTDPMPLNLWEINRDGSGRKVVVDQETLKKNMAEQSGYSDGLPISVQKVENGRIYFIVTVYSSGDDGILQTYSVDMQGGDMRLEETDAGKDAVIEKNSTAAAGFTYMFDSGRITRKSNGGDAEVIYQNDSYTINSFAVQGDWVYFIERQNADNELCNIHCVNVQTHADQTVLELPRDPGYFIQPVNVLGNWIYFLNNECLLCRVPINGGDVETILRDPVFEFVLFDQTIFYTSAEIVTVDSQLGLNFNALLRRVDLDGTNDMAIDISE